MLTAMRTMYRTNQRAIPREPIANTSRCIPILDIRGFYRPMMIYESLTVSSPYLSDKAKAFGLQPLVLSLLEASLEWKAPSQNEPSSFSETPLTAKNLTNIKTNIPCSKFRSDRVQALTESRFQEEDLPKHSQPQQPP